jgi:hypothetical protein
MDRKMLLCLWVVVLPARSAVAPPGESGTKELSGMCIGGNDEAPKYQFMVAW